MCSWVDGCLSVTRTDNNRDRWTPAMHGIWKKMKPVHSEGHVTATAHQRTGDLQCPQEEPAEGLGVEAQVRVRSPSNHGRFVAPS